MPGAAAASGVADDQLRAKFSESAQFVRNLANTDPQVMAKIMASALLALPTALEAWRFRIVATNDCPKRGNFVVSEPVLLPPRQWVGPPPRRPAGALTFTSASALTAPAACTKRGNFLALQVTHASASAGRFNPLFPGPLAHLQSALSPLSLRGPRSPVAPIRQQTPRPSENLQRPSWLSRIDRVQMASNSR